MSQVTEEDLNFALTPIYTIVWAVSYQLYLTRLYIEKTWQEMEVKRKQQSTS